MRRGLLLLTVLAASLFAAAGCEQNRVPARAAPTPGPRISVREISSTSGGDAVARGERIRFAVIGTGTGTHFGPSTFLHSAALTELQVVAVESSAKLYGQAMVSLATADGPKDLSAVTGNEIAIGREVFDVQPARFFELGAPPTSTDGVTVEGSGVIDPAGDVDLYTITPGDVAAHTLLIRVDRTAGDPSDFQPSLEVYDASGKSIARTQNRCVSLVENSRAPIYVRIADPSRRGGTDRRYRVVSAYGNPEDCLAAYPGDLAP